MLISEIFLAIGIVSLAIVSIMQTRSIMNLEDRIRKLESGRR